MSSKLSGQQRYLLFDLCTKERCVYLSAEDTQALHILAASIEGLPCVWIPWRVVCQHVELCLRINACMRRKLPYGCTQSPDDVSFQIMHVCLQQHMTPASDLSTGRLAKYCMHPNGNLFISTGLKSIECSPKKIEGVHAATACLPCKIEW